MYASWICLLMALCYSRAPSVGWSSSQAQPMSQNFAQPYAQPYDQAAYAGGQDIGVKGRLINLISAVRTLMRSKSTARHYVAS